MSGKIYHEELLWRDIAQINNTLINVRKELDKFNSSNNEVSIFQEQLCAAIKMLQKYLMDVKKYMENEFDKTYPAINDLQDQIVMNKKQINELQKQIQNIENDFNIDQLTNGKDLISELKTELKPLLEVELKRELKLDSRDKLKDKLRIEIKRELKDELKRELEFELKHQLKRELKDELEAKLKSMLNQDYDSDEDLIIVRNNEPNNEPNNESSKKKRKLM